MEFLVIFSIIYLIFVIPISILMAYRAFQGTYVGYHLSISEGAFLCLMAIPIIVFFPLVAIIFGFGWITAVLINKFS